MNKISVSESNSIRSGEERRFGVKLIARRTRWSEDGTGIILYVRPEDWGKVFEATMEYNTGSWPGYDVQVAGIYYDDPCLVDGEVVYYPRDRCYRVW
jgi:hypothetical protein